MFIRVRLYIQALFQGELRQGTGWQFHDLQAEYQRQGVPNENWSICTMNRDYRLCPTYPKDIYVPTLASQAVVEGSAKFRSKGRLPVLTYLARSPFLSFKAENIILKPCFFGMTENGRTKKFTRHAFPKNHQEKREIKKRIKFYVPLFSEKITEF